MLSGGGVDQLSSDTHLRISLLHAAFQNISDTHLPPDVLYLHRLAFVGKSRVAGDDKQTRYLREVSGKDVSEAVAEIVLVRIFAHIDKGQDNDGGFIRQGQGRWGAIRPEG